jgi:hypothetical protein
MDAKLASLGTCCGVEPLIHRSAGVDNPFPRFVTDRSAVWNALKTMALVTVPLPGEKEGYVVTHLPDLVITASSADWELDDPMALVTSIMEYKPAGAPKTYDRDLCVVAAALEFWRSSLV